MTLCRAKPDNECVGGVNCAQSVCSFVLSDLTTVCVCACVGGGVDLRMCIRGVFDLVGNG